MVLEKAHKGQGKRAPQPPRAHVAAGEGSKRRPRATQRGRLILHGKRRWLDPLPRRQGFSAAWCESVLFEPKERRRTSGHRDARHRARTSDHRPFRWMEDASPATRGLRMEETSGSPNVSQRRGTAKNQPCLSSWRASHCSRGGLTCGGQEPTEKPQQGLKREGPNQLLSVQDTGRVARFHCRSCGRSCVGAAAKTNRFEGRGRYQFPERTYQPEGPFRVKECLLHRRAPLAQLNQRAGRMYSFECKSSSLLCHAK